MELEELSEEFRKRNDDIWEESTKESIKLHTMNLTNQERIEKNSEIFQKRGNSLDELEREFQSRTEHFDHLIKYEELEYIEVEELECS